MSHVTKIQSVPIKDIKAIQLAVAELKRQGVNCELVDNRERPVGQRQGPRLYNKDQERAHANCDFVLKLPDAAYDVGFEAEYDENGKFKSYATVTDFYTPYGKKSVASVLGFSNQKDNEDANLLRMGKFYQNYSTYAAKNAARDAGYMVQETRDNNGVLHLTMTGMI